MSINFSQEPTSDSAFTAEDLKKLRLRENKKISDFYRMARMLGAGKKNLKENNQNSRSTLKNEN